MPNLIRFNQQAVTDAVRQSEQFLLQQQDTDGCWRDYNLEPGNSEAWTTAFVLHSLLAHPSSSIPVATVNAATGALLHLLRPTGWGYNRHTATDGDSTAWACRVLAGLSIFPCTHLATLLQNYIHDNGSSCTFLVKERFGNWASHHADVQPMIGLALLRCYANETSAHVPELTALIYRLRNHCLLSAGNELWSSFWWTSDAYAIAINLEFLQSSGGIPDPILQLATLWLMQTHRPQSAFEAALFLKIALLCGSGPDIGTNLTEYLLATQLIDGSWASAEALLVPPQFEDPNTTVPAFADIKRLMSTAIAMAALKTILPASGGSMLSTSYRVQ